MGVIVAAPDLRFITKRYFDDFEDPNVINQGWCFVWAWMAHLHTGAELCLYEFRDGAHMVDDAHAFVRLEGKYFDSSVPRGVGLPKIKKMWLFKEWYGHIPNCDRVRATTPAAFKAFWTRNGRKTAWGDQNLRPWPRAVL